MSELFLRIVNMSISASWLILTVLGLRLVLKKAPKWFRVLLWGIVAVRLLFPFSIESALSLIPSAETIPADIGMNLTPAISSGIDAINNFVNPVIGQSNAPAIGASINPLQITVAVCANIWMLGAAALLIYGTISYWRLRRRVETAVFLRENIFLSESIASPFVLGIIRPRIYLPFRMEAQNLEPVVAHEQAHIRRRDHWWKPLGFLLVTIHWFNPLMWAAYVLLCRDIELACDEKVIKELDNENRADYTQALVACSTNRRMIAACPVAFGEVGVKERVKSIMDYKKPGLWINILAVVFCALVAVCYLTNPVKAAETVEPDSSSLEIRPEEATNPPLASDDEKSGKQEETESFGMMESVTDVPEEDAAHTQAELEWTLEKERRSLEETIKVLEREAERIRAAMETEQEEGRRASLEETINVLEKELAHFQAAYEAMIEAEGSK